MANENLESKRWLIAIAAVVIQLCLGTVYAWSVFKNPLMNMHGWDGKTVQYTFMLLMLIIGLAAAFGGTLVDKKGPRFVATIGGILFGIGTLVAGYADQTGSIVLLYVGFGVIAALGNGFGYVTPIATLIRWFPDKRGLVTGLAVMGFGAGAFFMGKIAPGMIAAYKQVDDAGVVTSSGVAMTWYIWGVIFLPRRPPFRPLTLSCSAKPLSVPSGGCSGRCCALTYPRDSGLSPSTLRWHRTYTKRPWGSSEILLPSRLPLSPPPAAPWLHMRPYLTDSDAFSGRKFRTTSAEKWCS
jgi:OFA family oxalate/formate antiporter-like MFS transporter